MMTLKATRGPATKMWQRLIQPPIRCLNRVFFEPEELHRAEIDGPDVNKLHRVVLKSSDKRAIHIREILKINGAELKKEFRVGVVGGNMGHARLSLPEFGNHFEDEIEHRNESQDLVLDLDIQEPVQSSLEHPSSISLLLAAPRPKRMRHLLSILAQLGVREVAVTNACRVEKAFLNGGILTRSSAIRELLLEGLSQQAYDTDLPEISICSRLKPFVEDELGPHCDRFSHKLLLHPPFDESVESLATLKLENNCEARDVLLAIGPEGGWVDFELKLFQEAGFKCVHMGPRILRTDVAVVAAISLVRAALSR